MNRLSKAIEQNLCILTDTQVLDVLEPISDYLYSKWSDFTSDIPSELVNQTLDAANAILATEAFEYRVVKFEVLEEEYLWYFEKK